MQYIILEINDDVKRNFKIYCAKHKLSAKYIITEYILKILASDKMRLKQKPKGNEVPKWQKKKKYCLKRNSG